MHADDAGHPAGRRVVLRHGAHPFAEFADRRLEAAVGLCLQQADAAGSLEYFDRAPGQLAGRVAARVFLLERGGVGVDVLDGGMHGGRSCCALSCA